MSKRRHVGIASGAVLSALIAAGCSGGGDGGSQESTAAASATSAGPAEITVNEPVVATYDGGLMILDGDTLQMQAEVPMQGFLRINPAGDDSHVMVSTGTGFETLDAVSGRMTDVAFPAPEPGHVVVHGEKTILFSDGTGEITVFDTHDLADGEPETQKFSSPAPHHGVAVVLEDGTLVRSEGTEEGRTGAVALTADGQEIATSSECPGLHGETVAAGEVVAFGCENGTLIFRDGAFTKVPSAAEYGRTGTLKGHGDSPVALGDYKIDPDAELERPDRFILLDTVANQTRVVPLPEGVSYSWRSLGRGAHGEALILGTDGKLHVIDPVSAEIVRSIDVVQPWTEPDDWQQPRPALFTRDHDVYVTDPASNEIHLVDLEAGEVTQTAGLPNTPNEISGTVGHEH